MTERLRLQLPDNSAKVLLHTCCAPCSGEVIEAMQEAGIALTIYFYNPNIHPREEYEQRKEENIRFAKQKSIPFIDADYDPETWFERVKGLESEPERGERCTRCFDLRLERSALHAHENGFTLFTSCLGVSRWKNMEQVNASGHKAAARYEGLCYWDYNWRKGGGSNRMVEIAKRENFYRQEYCGCVYSLRDANQHRRDKGLESIKLGDKFYGKENAG
jgi:predicted adenine nucleotide alpha hydrolase (AANH) superfamily ATPase